MKLLSIPFALILIIVAPIILWNAESQQRTADFTSATEVEAQSEEEGYLRVRAEAEADGDLVCPQEVIDQDSDATENCIYLNTTVNEYSLVEEEVCRSTRPDNVVRDLDREECDSDGENCQPCYLVENEKWERVESESEYSNFKVGDYDVRASSDANIIGTDEVSVFLPVESQVSADNPESFPEVSSSRENSPRIGDREVVYRYIADGQQIIVAGQADDGEISSGDREFVISTLTYSETVSELSSQDSAAQWGLRILSLILVVTGFVMMLTTIAAVPGFFLDAIPVIGDRLEDKLVGIAGTIGGCLGFIAWLIMFAIVMVLKNILALIAMFAVLIIIAVSVFVLLKVSAERKAKQQQAQ
jgi:hypothetical protein